MSGKRIFSEEDCVETGSACSLQGKVIVLKPEAGNESSQQLTIAPEAVEQQPMLWDCLFLW